VLSLRGQPVRISSPAQAAGHGLAYVPEDRRRHGVIPEMTVVANTTLAILGEVAGHGFLNFRREREIAAEFAQKFAIKAPSLDAPSWLSPAATSRRWRSRAGWPPGPRS
jgi:ABC-type sugar transport system ATPase subunit